MHLAEDDRSAEEEVLDIIPGNLVRLEAALRDLLKRSAPRAPGAFSTFGIYHYKPAGSDPLIVLLLKAFLASHDPQVPTSTRRALRAFLSKELRKKYLREAVLPRPPGPQPRLRPGELGRLRAAYHAVLALLPRGKTSPVKEVTVEETIQAVAKAFPEERTKFQKRARQLSAIMNERQAAPHERARKALGTLFDVSVDTVNAYLKKAARRTHTPR